MNTKETVRLYAVGDISLETPSVHNPFRRVAGFLADKDILLGNLETPLSERGEPVEKAVVFTSPPDRAVWLKDAGFDVVHLANNHLLDAGVVGFHDTIDTLNQQGIEYIGARNTQSPRRVRVRRKGITFGFLGYKYNDISKPDENIWISGLCSGKWAEEIKSLKSDSDIVIVSLHWGIENVTYPSLEQINLARRMIEAGATVVIGHHPHVLQGIEPYRNGLVAYSTGNFQFNHTNLRDGDRSIVLRMEFTRDGLCSYDFAPVYIDEEYCPLLAEPGDNTIPEWIHEISRPIMENTITSAWWYEQIGWEYLRGNLRSSIRRIRKYGIGHVSDLKWLLRPFTLKCYAGIIRRWFKGS